MNGYEIIEEAQKMFANECRYGVYYSRYTEVETEKDGYCELCIEDEIISKFRESETITDYDYSTERFDGGPGYEATVIFFAWIENGGLCTDQILTECM